MFSTYFKKGSILSNNFFFLSNKIHFSIIYRFFENWFILYLLWIEEKGTDSSSEFLVKEWWLKSLLVWSLMWVIRCSFEICYSIFFCFSCSVTEIELKYDNLSWISPSFWSGYWTKLLWVRLYCLKTSCFIIQDYWYPNLF